MRAHRITTIGLAAAVVVGVGVGAFIIDTLRKIDKAVESAWQR